MCQSCGAQIPPQSRGAPRKFCLGCRPRKYQLRESTSAACAGCGVTFMTREASRKYCTQQCCWRTRSRERDKTRGPQCCECGKQMYTGRGVLPEGQAKCRQCRWGGLLGCGTAASYKRGCRCADCRRANAEATRNYLPPAYRHHWISPADRIAIYDRDDWTCQLCGKPVDLTVHHLHRGAPSLDHIEPQSLALIPDHAPANLRTAHRGCNSARGNRVAA